MKTNSIVALFLASLPLLVACASQAPEQDDTEGSEVVVGEENESDFVVLDRMGRPEMTNVTLGMGMKEIEADTRAPESEQLAKELANQDAKLSAHVRAYNHQNTFHPRRGDREHAKRVLSAGIRSCDVVGRLSKNDQDWTAHDIEIVTDILSEDALVVDLSKRCDINTQSFFDIEREEYLQRGGTANDASYAQHRTCGGRTLNDDVIDEMLTMWINKSFDLSLDNPLRVTDHIDKPKLDDGEPSNTFPYLGEAHADYKE